MRLYRDSHCFGAVRVWHDWSRSSTIGARVLERALFGPAISPQETLIFPGLLKKEALEAGNPLATHAAMIDLEPEYLKSKIFAEIYPEIRFNFEELLGLPLAGVQAMSLPMYRRNTASVAAPIPPSYQPRSALSVIEREAKKTRLVVFGEEHHLPQTRSLYESLLRVLWRQGYWVA